MSAGSTQAVRVEEEILPTEIAGAPLWAQMLWTLHRRQFDDAARQALEWDKRFDGLHDALVDHAHSSVQAHDELTRAVETVIGKPADERGHGGGGLAGEISILRMLIGQEPDACGTGGKGVLGRLAAHDRHRTTWDIRWAQFRMVVATVAFFGAIIAWLLSEKLGKLFKAPA